MINREKKIPTLAALLLIGALIASLILIQQKQIFFSGASQSIVPQSVQITNITDNSFTVSWITAKKVSGLVKLMDSGGERIFPDIRDKTGQLGLFTTHYIEVVGLSPNQKYRFVIISDGKEFLAKDNRPYQTRTARLFAGKVPRANLASGRVETVDGQPAAGAIVYFKVEGVSPLSSLVTSQGNWVISLAKAFSDDLSRLADYQDGLIVAEILVQAGEQGQARARVFTQDDDPVPLIRLGEEHDFTRSQPEAGPTQAITPTPTMKPDSRLTGLEDEGIIYQSFKIINPEEGEVITTVRPEIFGTGPQGTRVKIVLESPIKYQAELEVDNQGNWRWSPPQDLDPGPHTLTVTYLNPETGQEETFIRTFVLAANNDLGTPSFVATPSADWVTPTPTLRPSPTPTILSTPTGTPIPTSTPTPRPTSSIRTSLPSTESGVPTSGFWQPTFMMMIGGILVLMGMFLVVF